MALVKNDKWVKFVLQPPGVTLLRTQIFVFRVADWIEFALGAFWLAREAQRASVVDQLKRKREPFFLRNDLYQVLFDLDGLRVFGQIQASRKPLHMRVDHDALHYAEGPT